MKRPNHDRALDDRISRLYRSLADLADRHAEFVENLRPENPAPWPEENLYPPLSLNPIVIR